MNFRRQESFYGYKFSSYGRGDGFQGYRNGLEMQEVWRGWTFRNAISHEQVKSGTDKGYFFRPNVQVQKLMKNWANHTIDFQYQLERNAIQHILSDSMAQQSFSFQTMRAGLKSDLQKPNKWALDFINRKNSYPVGKQLIPVDQSNSIQLTTDLMRSEKHQFHASAIYRNLTVTGTTIPSLKSDESLLSRFEYKVNEWQGLLTGDLLYETGAGQEQKRDLAYIEVPAGQGEYTWNDYNGDGVQQLNEFEAAVFRDQAKYIRIFTPTNEFVKANYNSFNYSVQVVPRAIWSGRDLGRFKKVIAKFQLISSLQLQKKELSSGSLLLTPWSGGLKDSGLISLNARQMNSVAFNRANTTWGIDLTHSKGSTRALLAYGYETRTMEDLQMRVRWNPGRLFSTDLTTKQSFNKLSNSAKTFGNRNYDIQQWLVEPRLSYTQGSSFRIMVSYRWQTKINRIGLEEKAAFSSVNSEMKYNLLQSLSLQSRFTMTDIRFTAVQGTVNNNSPSSYIMLEGLMPGKNYLWGLDLTKRLSNSLELTMQYEGRKPGTARMVHVGRAGLRALL